LFNAERNSSLLLQVFVKPLYELFRSLVHLVVLVILVLTNWERRVRNPNKLPHHRATNCGGRRRLYRRLLVQHLQHALDGIDGHGVVLESGRGVSAREERVVAVALAAVANGGKEVVGGVAAAELVLPGG